MTQPLGEPHDRPRLLGLLVTQILVTVRTVSSLPPQADLCRAVGSELYAKEEVAVAKRP